MKRNLRGFQGGVQGFVEGAAEMALIELTEAATARLREMESASGKRTRLAVRNSGCSGLRYDLSQVEGPLDGDEEVSFMGAYLYVAASALPFVAGTKVDWVDSGLSRSFTFANPNESGRCGCGESFTVGGCDAN